MGVLVAAEAGVATRLLHLDHGLQTSGHPPRPRAPAALIPAVILVCSVQVRGMHARHLLCLARALSRNVGQRHRKCTMVAMADARIRPSALAARLLCTQCGTTVTCMTR